MKLSVFIPCCVDQFSPKTASNLIGLLESLGHEVHYNESQTCCGRLLYDNGNWDSAKLLGEKFIDEFKGSEYIVSCSTECVGYIKNNFGKLFFNTTNHNSYKSIRDRVMDISEFLVSFMRKTDFGVEFPHKVSLHSNCHGLNEYNVEEETKLLLQNVKGLELTNNNTNRFCCGLGGTFSIHNEPVSTALAKKKIDAILAEGAEYVVSNDMSCLLHLQSYIDKHKINLKTIHLVDLLMYNK
ncbi:MAG: (Fe-S)-binding protein [Bacteroidales bacterium]|nr:(Fe-S)-binding protein [Bacteroidales bacterium]